ncbi:hypothetical protein SNE510_25830 [Streptomyces sp. NE5-10]|uniref:hypothetical protein n=1 Tax=Streptomyces sp. NE5-10 TaxID=2759674 RepID=UPI001902E082|nr:hypothetical protein [Streptomyces sp. NE5-10]GHJ93064.1 hypothetical protein SNE510_25830 [Streptomyces sp. NE5-10]
MNLRSSWTVETGQTREDTRLTQTGVTTLANPVQVRSGVLPGSYDGQYRLAAFWTFGSAPMTATVSEGRAVIQGEISQGAYPVTLPNSETLTFAPGNAQYGRIDLIVLKIYDGLYDDNQRYEAKLEILQGTPDPTPQVPQVPERCLPLYQVLVPAGASAGNGGIPWATSLTDLRTPVVSLGGILPVEGPVQPGAYPGQYQDAGGALQRWDGGAWVPYSSATGGIVPASAGNVPASYTGQYRDSSGGVLQRWNGTAWRPAHPGPYFTGSNDDGYTTSTTFSPTLQESPTPLSVSFTGPPSGAVLVNFGARIWSSSATHAVSMGMRLTQDTVTSIGESDEFAVVSTGTTPSSAASVTRFYNLTPGASYKLTAMFKVAANTTQVKGYFDSTFMMIHPQN